jgi:hypothetical protein
LMHEQQMVDLQPASVEVSSINKVTHMDTTCGKVAKR